MAGISVINSEFQSPVICVMVTIPLLYGISPPLLKQCSAMAPNNQLKMCTSSYKVIKGFFFFFFKIKIDCDKVG